MIRKLVKVVPKSSLTAVLVLLGVMSSIASDAGYLVLIPLGAAVFYKVGRHPLAGLSAGLCRVFQEDLVSTYYYASGWNAYRNIKMMQYISLIHPILLI